LWANEGYTARDISQVLGCSASTARVTLFNARRKIKALLENDHGLLQIG
jgi:DNA-directed RNA polymerase specialized sigma24 family protein